MTVTWQPPVNDGGSPVINYKLEQKVSTEVGWNPVTTDDITDTKYTVTKLKTGKEYEFRVSAVNKAGQGKWSPPSDEVVVKAPVGKCVEKQTYVLTLAKFR